MNARSSMAADDRDAERATFRAFLTSPRRERVDGLLVSARGRARVTAMLAHCTAWDPRWSAALNRHEQRPETVVEMLRGAGAPPSCLVVSEDEALDGHRMALEAAVAGTEATDGAALLICVPARLAYVKDEELRTRWLLRR